MRNLIWFSLILITGCQSGEEAVLAVKRIPQELNSKPLVTVVEVQKKNFKHFFNAQGSVTSKEMAFIRPEMSGTIKTLFVKEGDYVKKGQNILSISTNLLNAQIAEVNEQLSFAKYLFDKQKILFEDEISSEIQLKEAENNLNRVQKSKATLLTQLEKSKVIAPFSGFIETILVQIGESVGPMNPVCHLINTNELFIVADISENLLSNISIGNPVNVYFPSLDLEVNELKLNRIGRIVNKVNRTVKIESKLPASKGLIPNLMAEIRINHYSKDSAVCLPSRLVLKDSKGSAFLKILDGNNRVVIYPVQVGKTEKTVVEIISDLRSGTLVVDDGKSTVLEGQEVEIISGNNL
ncbi:MAG: efflux RND transporter periplasmic adaptor subunit [Flavobacteriales bacterium]|jgi:RND family efflux transporter MFP subunit